MSKPDRISGTLEWAVKNVNCVTGCEHGCRYCYARYNAVQRLNEIEPPQPESAVEVSPDGGLGNVSWIQYTFRCPHCNESWTTLRKDTKYCFYCDKPLNVIVTKEEEMNEDDKKKEDNPIVDLFPDLSSLFDKVGQIFKKERVVHVTEGQAMRQGGPVTTTSSTLLIVPKSVELKEAEGHWRDWCKKSFAEYLVEFKGAKVIEVEEFTTQPPGPTQSTPIVPYRSGAPGHGGCETKRD